MAAEAKLKGPPPSLVVMLAVLRQRFELDDTAKLEEVESAAARELVGGTSQKGFTPDHKNFARRVKAVWMAACDAKEREEEGGAAPAAAPSTSHPASITGLVDTVEPSSPPPTWSS